jgi:hypothetical protein
MDAEGLLPKSDLEQLSIGFVSMVGVATPKNPERYSQLNDKRSYYSQVLGPDARSVSIESTHSSDTRPTRVVVNYRACDNTRLFSTCLVGCFQCSRQPGLLHAEQTALGR